MRYAVSLAMLAGCLVSAIWLGQPQAAERTPRADKTDAAVGIQERVLWTTSKVKGSPEPPAPYRLQPVFPKVKFSEPLEMRSVANRLFVAERRGKIFSFENRQDAEPELFLNVGRTVYGLAMHPQFDKNGFVYVVSVLDDQAPAPKGTRLSRFQAADNRRMADPASERVLLEWPSGGHNGGCIDFGPDGLLYIVTGDGSGIADELQTGQDIGDLLASILRIDVDRPTIARPYGIPTDNPFANTAGARPEVYAYGLRQAWKFSFDRQTGDLWAGEIGQDLWESVHKIVKGGNYGWSVHEAAHPFRPERTRGPSAIIPPIVEHPHVDFRSITGGYVYHGSRLKELAGAYIYGDYDTGKVAALRHDGSKVTWQQELVDSPLRIICFGEDHAGEIYLVDFMGGGLHQLVPAPKEEKPAEPFPRKLSETGLFTATATHTPAPGLIPYSVNSELWSDNSIKERFLALPGNSRIEFETVTYPQPAPGAPRGWRFPDGTVVVKTFAMEMEKGNPASRRRLETRILHHERLAGTEEIGDQVWRGYTYVWNDEQTDAELLDAKGADRELTIRDPEAPGGFRKQTWHFPSRSECTLCHTMPAKFVLGVNTLQMNKDHDYGHGVVANQLRTLNHIGAFTEPLPVPPEELPALVNPYDTRHSIDARARSYLHSNCAHCHMKWGGGNAEFQLLGTLDLKDSGTIGVRPGHGLFGVADGKVLVPGDPERSIALLRMEKLGLGRMPHVGSSVVDQQAVQLIRNWIRQLPDHESRGISVLKH